jgi:hypothetical protein
LQSAQENFQVEGNPQVQDFLRRWLQKAEEGKLNFVGLVACLSQTQVFVDHVGVIGTEFAANFGIDNLKHQVMTNVFRRLPPDNQVDAPADRVVYNLASGPCSFDFLAWLQIQQMRRNREGVQTPLQVAFAMGTDQNLDRCLITDQRRTMYENVMRALIPMMGAVEVPIIQLLKQGPARWPETYTLNAAVELYQQGVPMPKLTPADTAVEMVDKYLAGRRPVVITLREASHWPHRNSNIPEWLKFCDYLSGKGEDVIIVRDTAKADEPFGAYHTCPPASKEINSRVALYQRAKVNMFAANGPCTLCFFLDNPWFLIGPLDPSRAYPPGCAEWWYPHHGIQAYSQFPWSGPNQRIIWELDTADTLIAAWEKFDNGEFADRAVTTPTACYSIPEMVPVASKADSGEAIVAL